MLESLHTIASAVKPLNQVPSQLNVDSEKLQTIFVQNEGRKMEWIKKGVFKTMLKIFCVFVTTKFPKQLDIPLEVCKLFLVLLALLLLFLSFPFSFSF